MTIIPIEGSLEGLIIPEGLNPLGIIGLIGNLLEYLHLIITSLKIMRTTLHNLDGDIIAILKVLSQPNGRKVSPPKFLHQYIPITKYFTHMTRMITTNFVVLDALVLGVVLLV
jgi:hypothetical protein